MKAILALSDGRVFHGDSFGSTETRLGEVCFNTSMTGYQEVLTDPSYKGQIVTMTYPLIGNYGVNSFDVESWQPHVSGFVVREISKIHSSWRSEESLDAYLTRYKVPGICGIDTRALTKHLRTNGSTNGILTTEKMSDQAAIDLAKNWSYVGTDYVKEVSCTTPYEWDPQDIDSREWTIVKSADVDHSMILENGQAFKKLPPIKYKIVAYDFGMKRNILRQLRQTGFKVTVVPAATSADEVLNMNPDGVFLSNGPGDPQVLTYAHENVRQIAGKKPIFGICLGHQMLGYAFGGKTFKLKFGHRGGNQPVQDLKSGKVTITSQNHGFAVDPDSVKKQGLSVTHLNLNDQTCEGMCHNELPIFSVQYHPEAAPGPHDARYLFREFASMIERSH
ncbi:MAG: glutamine-hydrolyzing carbamoyl-phosphate synthase small subunit [Verrucomicrobiota bacterium]|nr:glutamine-hydrolyzing carbamoyl-phosphate synthase small subunit [Verrucomicrobiota bacterium]